MLQTNKKMAAHYNEFALALSGGGTRGIVHAGFLKALDEEGLKPAAIAGASMGAIVGAMYAAGVEPDRMILAIKKPEFLSLPSWIGLKGGIGSMDILRKQLEQFIQSDRFENLKIPLTVSVTNLNSGKNELISSGPLIEWVVASASIPIVFEPVFIGRSYYVDGGLTINMPAKCLVKKDRMVIGLNSNFLQEVDSEFKSMKVVGERSLFIAVQNTLRDQVDACDLYIEAKDVRSYGTFDFDHAVDIFEKGYQIGKENIGKIKDKLRPL